MRENWDYIFIGVIMNLLMIFDMYIIINDISNVNKFYPWLGTICTILWDILTINKFYYGKR